MHAPPPGLTEARRRALSGLALRAAADCAACADARTTAATASRVDGHGEPCRRVARLCLDTSRALFPDGDEEDLAATLAAAARACIDLPGGGDEPGDGAMRRCVQVRRSLAVACRDAYEQLVEGGEAWRPAGRRAGSSGRPVPL